MEHMGRHTMPGKRKFCDHRANLSPRERTDDIAILSCLTKGYPRTRMKDLCVKTKTKISEKKSRTMNSKCQVKIYCFFICEA